MQTSSRHGASTRWSEPGVLLSVTASIRYQDGSAERTLVANGKIYTKKDGNGNTKVFGAKPAPHEVHIRNAREEPASLDTHGAQLFESPTGMKHEDFYDETAILQRYYPECAALVKKVTGASVVKPFDHNIRSASGEAEGKRIQGGNAVRGPSYTAHADYTLTSAPLRLEQMADPPRLDDVVRKLIGDTPLLSSHEVRRAQQGRYAIINVWRNIKNEPVERYPLAVCDASSATDEDFCVFELDYGDRTGEIYFIVHSPQQQWFYYPHMHRGEALLLKQWDSDGILVGGHRSTFAAHAAFADPTTPESAPDRESIEVRCICIFDETTAETKAAPTARL